MIDDGAHTVTYCRRSHEWLAASERRGDALSDLAYYGARFYDRTAISWTQADPLFRFVPDLAKRDNPRRANLYQFTLSNPLRYIDPDGRNPRNTSDYRSEAEVRASYASALEFWYLQNQRLRKCVQIRKGGPQSRNEDLWLANAPSAAASKIAGGPRPKCYRDRH